MKTAIRILAAVTMLAAAGTAVAQDRPNILIVWGDDIGYWNISAYNRGMMGYRTPNIDRIAREGAIFTDAYGEQSCTAGRAAFITGQSPFRTGLTKVGMPGADLGLQAEDPTIAEYLKSKGYATGQFGKNHLGDLDEHLPTNHGFDEFFGNLYHLNAEDEPEHVDYPKDPAFKERFGPRGVIRASADGEIVDTGPLNKKRMETVDDEVTAAAIDFMERAVESDEPFFLWWNSTRMHVWTRLKAESEGVTGLGIYPDGMVEHDGHIGQLLDKLDELGIADNTIVMYSTDNGAEKFTWPDGGTAPFRGEKNDNWEGGYRVPLVVRWPGVIEPGTEVNQIDLPHGLVPHPGGGGWVMTASRTSLKTGHFVWQQALSRSTWMATTCCPTSAARPPAWPRKEFFYFSDGGDLLNLRYRQWKIVFAEQRAHGFDVWSNPFTFLRFPKLFNLRSDPFEHADEIDAMGYQRFRAERMFVMVPAQAYVAQFLETFEEFPPRQTPASFTIDQVMERLQPATN